MLPPNLFNTILVFPILNILVAFYKALSYVHLPGAFGWAVIGLTVSVRLLLHPFFKQQLETAKKMQDIKPHLDKLSIKHKKDPKKLQQEQMRLYQESGINPASGCLFLIIQMPIFIALYQTLSLFLLKGHLTTLIAEINKVLYFSFLKIQSIDPWFFGFNLGLTPAKSGQWYYYVIPVITGILQYFQAQSTAMVPVEDNKAKDQKNNDQKKDDTGDFQKAMNMQMKYIFPFMIGWFSYTLPVGLSLYWNIFSLFSIIQYKQIKVKNSLSNDKK